MHRFVMRLDGRLETNHMKRKGKPRDRSCVGIELERGSAFRGLGIVRLDSSLNFISTLGEGQNGQCFLACSSTLIK